MLSLNLTPNLTFNTANMVSLRNSLFVAVAAATVLPANCAPTDAAAPPPVPIALGGKEASISQEFIELMKPEYDVVHVIDSAPNGMAEFPPLIKGQITIPVSLLGSNVNNLEPKKPKAVFIGGGFSEYEIEMMYSIKAVQKVPWLFPPPGRENGTVVPPTAFIAETVKMVFAANGLVPGNVSDVQPGVWSFGPPPS